MNGKLQRTKEPLSWVQPGGEPNTKYTPILFVCLPPTSGACHSSYYPQCVCVCGKGVATHTELVAYKQTMRDTQLRRERAEAE